MASNRSTAALALTGAALGALLAWFTLQEPSSPDAVEDGDGSASVDPRGAPQAPPTPAPADPRAQAPLPPTWGFDLPAPGLEGPPSGDTGAELPAPNPLAGLQTLPGSVVTLPDPAWPVQVASTPLPWRGRASSPAWSSDGQLVYVHSDGKRSQLVAWSSEGARAVPGTEGASEPAWSAEGGLLFTRGGRLWGLVEGAPKALVPLEEVPGSLADLAVRGSRLAFVADARSVYVWDMAEGRIRLLASLSDGVSGLAWLPDGRLVFTRTREAQSDLWVLDGEGRAEALVAGPLPELRPAASPAGELLYLRQAEPGSWELLRDGELLDEDVLLPTRGGASVDAAGRVAVADDAPGTLLLFTAQGPLELVTGLEWVADPALHGGKLAFAGPGGLRVLSLSKELLSPASPVARAAP